jgi:hypothetical protein
MKMNGETSTFFTTTRVTPVVDGEENENKGLSPASGAMSHDASSE